MRDRKREYNVIFEARSGISFVKFMSGMALASFPWKPQCPLFSEYERERDTLKNAIGYPCILSVIYVRFLTEIEFCRHNLVKLRI
jgi:hypothetical protein